MGVTDLEDTVGLPTILRHGQCHPAVLCLRVKLDLSVPSPGCAQNQVQILAEVPNNDEPPAQIPLCSHNLKAHFRTLCDP